MTHLRGYAASGFLARRGLLVAATGGAMAEAAVLAALAPAARGLAPQVTALPPLAVYHDLRWLFGFGLPWPVFILLAAVLVGVRSAVSAGLIRLAWPAGSRPPALPALLWSCTALTVFAALLLSPVVALMFGASVVPFSWPFLASLAMLVLLMIPISHGGVLGSWWQTLPPVTAAAWLIADFAVLTIAAAAIARLPVAWAVLPAGLAGLFNARAWYGVTAAVADDRHRATGHLPLAPLAAVSAVALAIGVARLAFFVAAGDTPVHHSGTAPASAAPANAVPAHGAPVLPGQVKTGPAGTVPVSRAPPDTAAGRGQGTWPGGRAAAHPARGRLAVLVVAGFGSSCCGHGGDVHRILPGWWVQQFSYRGMTKGGRPLAHGPMASNLPLAVLGDRIAAQVWRLHEETGRPVNVVAESEGTLGVDAMLALHPRVPLDSVVLLSPIVAPGQDSYPSLTGPDRGLVAGAELRAVIWFVGGLSPFGTAGAQTFINSVDNVGARYAAQAYRRPVRLLQFVPLADAVTLPACPLPANVRVVPAFHGELLGDPAVLESVRDFLSRQPVHSRPGLRSTAEVVAAGAAAWRMPLLTAPSPPCPR
jgi:hypothetical protein